MIENTFNEEYFRVEKNITTNNESVYIDREGRLILTTQFITDENITDVSIQFAGENQPPKNFNMVVDAVTLFTTNPNCQNYLPLKISLGSKIQLEFNDATFQELENYKIIVNPRVNLDIIQNIRYTDPVNYWFTFQGTDVNSFVVNVVETQEGQISRFFYQEDPEGFVYGTDLNFNSYRVLDSGTPLRLVNIYGNNEQVVGYSTTGLGSRAYDLRGTTFLDPNVPLDGIIDVTNGEIQDIFLIKNLMIVFQQNTGSFEYELVYYVKTGVYRVVLEIPLGTTLIGVGVYTPDVFYTISNTQLIRYKVGVNGVTATTVFSFKSVFPIQAFDKMYFGGSNVDNPNISIVYSSNDELFWGFLPFPYTTFNISSFDLNAPNTFKNIVVKRYRNQAYFSDLSFHYFLNLDTGEVVRYNSIDKNNLVPRKITSKINLTRFNFIELQTIISDISEPSTVVEEVLATVFRNERDFRKIYKLTYNYDERNYLFDQNTYKNLFFQIKLPNGNPIADLEVFKYVIDGRVRYTKEKIDPYGIVKSKDDPQEQPLLDEEQCIEDCQKGCVQFTELKQIFNECKDGACKKGLRREECLKRCFTRCNRTTGSVNKILGLVDEGFNVSEFLNLYTTM